ncbi:radical SAM protein [Thermodesulfobacteriota bacterium]
MMFYNGRLLKNSFLSIFFNKYIPICTAFAVTYRCPIHCPMCRTVKAASPELDLDQIEILFKHLKSQGTHFLHLTGGEPLIRDDIVEISQLARSSGFYVTLNTSGGLLEEKLELLESNIDRFIVSLDGGRELHDSNRGPGAFDKTISALRKIHATGSKAIIETVFGEYNKRDIPSLILLSKETETPVKFFPIVLDDTFSSRERSMFEPTEDTRKEVSRHLLEERKRNDLIFMTDNAIKNLHSSADLKRRSCDLIYLRITPSGGLKRCSLTADSEAIAVDLRNESSFAAALFNMPSPGCKEPLLFCLEMSNILNFKSPSIVRILKKL